jgi:hypothetical protein
LDSQYRNVCLVKENLKKMGGTIFLALQNLTCASGSRNIAFPQPVSFGAKNRHSLAVRFYSKFSSTRLPSSQHPQNVNIIFCSYNMADMRKWKMSSLFCLVNNSVICFYRCILLNHGQLNLVKRVTFERPFFVTAKEQ